MWAKLTQYSQSYVLSLWHQLPTAALNQGQKPRKPSGCVLRQGGAIQCVKVPPDVLLCTASFRLARLHRKHLYSEIRGVTSLTV